MTVRGPLVAGHKCNWTWICFTFFFWRDVWSSSFFLFGRVVWPDLAFSLFSCVARFDAIWSKIWSQHSGRQLKVTLCLCLVCSKMVLWPDLAHLGADFGHITVTSTGTLLLLLLHVLLLQCCVTRCSTSWCKSSPMYVCPLLFNYPKLAVTSLKGEN